MKRYEHYFRISIYRETFYDELIRKSKNGSIPAVGTYNLKDMMQPKLLKGLYQRYIKL